MQTKAWLAAALGFSAAWSCQPAQAAEVKLDVSAVILPRIACTSASPRGGRPELRCRASDRTTAYRIRSERDPGASGPNRPHVVLIVEP